MMDLFKKAGAQVRHVPFSGDADAFQAIAGNRVQVYTSTAGSLDQYDVKGWPSWMPPVIRCCPTCPR